MKTGDLVEFKAGLFGIKPPQNYGIYLERAKRKGNFFVVLHTVKGKREVKPENVTARRLETRLEPPFNEGELTERLQALIKEVAKEGSETRGKADDKTKLTERALWLTVLGLEPPLSPDEMAEAHFGERPAKRAHVDSVKQLLELCAQRGVGYFDRVDGVPDGWVPIGHEEYGRAVREVEGLNALRKKLVKVEEVEDEEGYVRTVFHGIQPKDAGVDDADRRRLDLIARAMSDFVLHDRYRGVVGLGDTHVHAIDGFNFFTFLKWLATDWTGAMGTSISSTFVEFLVSTGLLDFEAAIVLVAKRKVLANAGFEWEQDPGIVRAAERLPDPPPPEWLAAREDFRGIECYTIDPPDARDHDDAVSFRREEDGGATLWIHIADVSRYVEPDTALDRDARKRATSVYLPTGVLPMLPERLSNDLCSLNEGVDRLAMSVVQRYDADGNLMSERFAEGLIRVTKNISYGKVDEAVKEGREPFADMERFARSLRAKRRGLVLESQELKIRLTAENVEHVLRHATPATEMVETFMVSANEAVARFLASRAIPALYRCHPLPERWRVDRFNGQMKTLGIQGRVAIELPDPEELAEETSDAEGEADGGGGGGSTILDQLRSGGRLEMFGGGVSVRREEDEREAAAAGAGAEGGAAEEGGASAQEAPSGPALKGLAQLPFEEQEAWLRPFRDALEEVDSLKEPLRGLVYQKALGAMGRAFYTTQNLGHFGLGSTCYAHFTSPIRRYPDLIVHRQLRWLLQKLRASGEPAEVRYEEAPPPGFLPAPAPGLPLDDLPHTEQALSDWGEHSSEQGAAAEDLERGTVAVSLVFATRSGAWDGDQDALVNGITKGGIFLSLPRGLEARLSVSDLPGGPYSVDDHDSMLFVGEHERPGWHEEVNEKNWRQFVKTGALGNKETVLVRVRLADVLKVRLAERDYVDGRVRVKLAGGEGLEEEAREI